MVDLKIFAKTAASRCIRLVFPDTERMEDKFVDIIHGALLDAKLAAVEDTLRERKGDDDEADASTDR